VTRLLRVVLCVACAAAVPAATGCRDDKPDNSKIQTPNDAPIGAPKGVGDGPPGQLKARETPLVK
jgi:hypothetical protein